MLVVFNIPFVLPLTISLMLVFLMREIFVFKNIIPAKYILTPIITLLIIIISILSLEHSSIERYTIMIIAGLLFSLIADALLMVVEVDLLKYGIVFFLIAHILYIIAFSGGYHFAFWNLILAFGLLAGIVLLFFKIKGKTSGLDIPILIYAIVLCLMVFFALSTLNSGSGMLQILVVTGSIMFLISDAIISVDAFIRKIPNATVFVWLFYAPAQFLFAISCYFI